MHKAVVLLLMLLFLEAAGPARAQRVALHDDDPEALRGFGRALALEGEEAFVGEPLNTLVSGIVYVFARDAATGAWVEQDRLAASDARVGDSFGTAVSVDAEALLVGAPTKDGRQGAAYVFRKDAATGAWVEEARLVASDGVPGDEAGRTVALSGDVALVGTVVHDHGAGAVYVFRRDAAGSWTEVAKLTGSDGQPDDQFGAALALEGDEVLVAAPRHNNRTGAVYVFRREATGAWVERAKLTGGDVQRSERFGTVLALEGAVLLVGVPFHNVLAGAVYVFERDAGGVWQEGTKLLPATGHSNDRFGGAVGLSGGVAWIGASLADNIAGRAYVFERNAVTNKWEERQQVTGSGVQGGNQFGATLAVAGSYAVVGVAGADLGAGAAYLFERESPTGTWVERAFLIGEAEQVEPITGTRVACAGGAAAGYGCGNADLLAFLPVHRMGGIRGARANDIWGWTDPQTGHEYALVGREDGTSFVDISDPLNPRYLGNLPTHTQPSGWRDVKVYANYAFIVADFAGNHGMQVFDLTQLRAVTGDPLTFSETAHYDQVASAHNLAINEDTGFAYIVGGSGGGQTCGGGLHMVDIRDPLHPEFVGCFQHLGTGQSGSGYTHDAQCVRYHGPDAAYQGREICIGSNETALSIADVTDKASPVVLAAATYPPVGYVHQGWLTEDHRYFFQDDELDEIIGFAPRTRTYIWDLADLTAPLLLATYHGTTGATDHNQYVVGHYVYQANYASGLRILDIRDVANPVEVAFFDTFAPNDDPGFPGAWSSYPFFASGVVIVSSREAGLFIVQPTGLRTGTEGEEVPAGFALSPGYPNPFNPETTLTLSVTAVQRVAVAVYDALGRRVAVLHEGLLGPGVHRLRFEASGLSGGVYVVRAVGEQTVQTRLVTLVK